MQEQNFKEQEDFTKNLLSRPEKVIRVKKVARAGFTTSLLKVCRNLGKTVTVLEPNNRILKDTVLKAIPDAIVTEPNETWCKYSVKDDLFEYWNKGKCDRCQCNPESNSYRGDICELQKFKKELPNVKCIGITYTKLFTVMSKEHKSDLDSMILQKIAGSDVILFDEFSNALEYQSLISVNYGEFCKLKEQPFLNPTLQASMKALHATIFESRIRLHGKIPLQLSHTDAKEINKNIGSIPKEFQASAKTVLKLLCKEKFAFDDSNIAADDGHTIISIKNWLDDVINDKAEIGYRGKIIISGLALPHTTIFDSIEVQMPDFYETEKKQLIICDKTHYDLEKNWYKEEQKILRVIAGFSSFQKKLLVVTMSMKHAKFIKRKLDNEDIQVLPYTYFRADNTAGIELPEKPRIMLCIGLPYTPNNAMDAYVTLHSEVFNHAYDSQECRKLEMQQVFENTIGRVKDPLGEEPSIVFVLGDRLNDTKDHLPEKKEIVEIKVKNSMHDVAPIMAGYWLYKHCNGYENLPVIAHTIYKMMKTGNEPKKILVQMQMHKMIQKSPAYYIQKYFSA